MTSTTPVPSPTGALEHDPAPGLPDLRGGYGAGLAIALLSAASFGLSGSLARSLLDLGWTPAAVVAVRISGAFVLLLVPCLVLLRRTGLPSLRQTGRMAVYGVVAVALAQLCYFSAVQYLSVGVALLLEYLAPVLLVPCLVLLRRTGLPTLRQTGRMAVYGVVAVALAQLCYFSAVQYLSVGVALLLEYLAPVLLIFWHWSRSGRRPAWSVFGGAALALLGLVFVLDLRSGVTLNPIGVLWGLGAAVCLCAYFVLSESRGEHGAVSPLLLTTVGTGVGGVVILAAAGVGLLPLAARGGSTVLAGAQVGWWLPVLLLIGVTAVLAYLTGIVAVRRLGSSVASFVSLAEVLFAVAFAVVLLAQQPSGSQVFGGALVLAGIAVVQRRAR